MRYIKVDSYGKCLHNKDLPESMKKMEDSFEDETFLDFISYYKFHISFENAICKDYMTEKLMRSLHLGSVPIYMGSPDVRDWEPNNRSIILAQDFDSPEELAKYLQFLNENDEEYDKFLGHKKSGGITNSFLKNNLQERNWHTHPSGSSEINDFNFFVGFECFVCEKMHKHYLDYKIGGDQFSKITFSHRANNSHMGCPAPQKILLSKSESSGRFTDFIWTRTYHQQKDVATAARQMVESGETHSSQFYKYLQKVKTEK